jgi:hypothetical protein
MIKLLDLLKEIQSIDSYKLSDPIIKVRIEVQKFFNANKNDLAKFVKSNDWDSFFKLTFKNLSQYKQDQVAQAISNEAAAAGWYTENPIPTYTGKVDAKKVSTQIDQNSDVNEINAVVSDWVKKNKSKLMKLSDSDKYNEFYQLVKDKFPLAQEDKLLYAMNLAAIEHGIHYELITEV